MARLCTIVYTCLHTQARDVILTLAANRLARILHDTAHTHATYTTLTVTPYTSHLNTPDAFLQPHNPEATTAPKAQATSQLHSLFIGASAQPVMIITCEGVTAAPTRG